MSEATSVSPGGAGAIPGYQILSKIGEGGMGVVYKARQLSLDRNVALKVLPRKLTESGEFVARFMREARVAGRLNHPHIVRVYDFGRSPTGICYYSMELVEGDNLHALLEREGRLPPGRVLRILEQIAGALEHAHRHGIIHRDIKPDNILIDAEGNAKLADLGLAKAERTRGFKASGRYVSIVGAIVGTPSYMPPEQAAGKEVDIRGDLYALGATAYHLLVGAPPFSGSTPVEVMVRSMSGPIEPLQGRVEGLPGSLASLIHCLLEKEPGARFQTPSELLEALRSVRKGMGETVVVQGKESTTRTSLLAWGVALAAALIGVGLWMARPDAVNGKTTQVPVKENPASSSVQKPPAAQENPKPPPSLLRAASLQSSIDDFILSADGLRLYAVGRPGSNLEIFFLPAMERRLRIGLSGDVSILSASPDGKRLAVAGRRRILIVNLYAGVVTRSFDLKTDIAGLYMADAETLYVLSGPRLLRIQVSRGQVDPTFNLRGPSEWLAPRPDGRKLYTSRGTILLPVAGQPSQPVWVPLRQAPFPAGGLVFRADSKLAISPAGTVHRLSDNPADDLATSGKVEPHLCAVFCGTGRLLLFTQDGRLRQYDGEGLRLVSERSIGYRISRAGADREGKVLYAVGARISDKAPGPPPAELLAFDLAALCD